MTVSTHEGGQAGRQAFGTSLGGAAAGRMALRARTRASAFAGSWSKKQTDRTRRAAPAVEIQSHTPLTIASADSLAPHRRLPVPMMVRPTDLMPRPSAKRRESITSYYILEVPWTSYDVTTT